MTPNPAKDTMDALLTATDLEHYLRNCGGRDILIFASSHEASEAAHAIRERHPEVDTRASYHKVILSLRTSEDME